MKIKRYSKNTLSVLLASAISSYAATASAENLLEVYSLAIENDPTIHSAYASRMATREALPTALAGFLPGLEGIAQLNSQDNDLQATLDPSLPSQAITRNQYVFANVNQTIFDLSRWHNLKQAKQTVSYADAAYMASEQDLIIRTATAYFDLLKAIDNLEFTQAEKKAVQRQLKQTNDKFEAGTVAITDVKDLQAQYDARTAEEIAAQYNVDNTRQQLKILTGHYISDVAGLDQLPLKSPEPMNDNEWVSMAELYNPTLQAAKYQSAAKGSAVKMAKDQRLPVFEFNGSYGQIRDGAISEPNGDWEQTWGTTVQGSIPLFSGGVITSNIRRAQYDHQAAQQDFEFIRRETETNTRNAFRNVISATGQVNAYERAVESANASLEANNAGYDAGTRTSVELLIIISNLYEQERNLAMARYDYILSILKLKQAAGTLNTEDVYLVNEWLEENRTQAGNVINSISGASGTEYDPQINDYTGYR